ncbi:TetR family transcriptional regulator [Streptomyces sp. SID3343]|uniref:TetR family transcriptional regulator n=1 Tax=Streptomyces sp. SID3343 TaxID=2690260 RepID=UPI00136B5B27|nr:TetR family transcriptional regulator [Streptomyces sp. SID3343]MYW05142.1 TetR family transcriptional regulator [Streptomyces sp. SID3343]
MTTYTKADRAPLTERQEARRRRILRATTQLAARGGYESVQMREVAELSEVALGTLYRYFPSKVHLLVATMYDQLERLHGQLRRRPPKSLGPRERVVDTLLRAFRGMQREPHLTEAMMRALQFADRSVGAEVDTVSRVTTSMILEAIHGDEPATEPTAEDLAVIRVITHTWHSSLIAWLNGRASIAQVRTDIETVTRLIRDDGEAEGA